MKYVTTERFIVSSNTSEAQTKYRDNYDAVFRVEGVPIEELPSEELSEEAVSSDGFACRVRGYVYECQTCKCLHTDPARHQHHGVFQADEPKDES